MCSLARGKKMALGHAGLQSISHGDRTKECPSGQLTGTGKAAPLTVLFPLETRPRAAITVPAWAPTLSQVQMCGAHSSWESRDHPVQPVPHIFSGIQGMDAARSGFRSYLLDGFKVRKEKVSVIVGHLVLQHGDQPFQAHPSINTFLRKGFQCPISFPAKER